MKEKISEEVLFYRQVNYLIIEKLWEYCNKGTNKKKFYELIGIKANAYSRIRGANTHQLVDLEKKWNEKNSMLRRMGLPKEIMVGLKPIEIEGITLEEWKEYLQYRYDDKNDSAYRRSVINRLNKELHRIFSGLEADKKTKSNIVKLFYFFTYGRAVELDMPDAEMVDLRDSLKNVSVDKMKVCDKALRDEIYESLKEKFHQLEIIINYEKLK